MTHLEVRFAQGRPEGGAERTSPVWGGGAGFDLGIHALALALLMAAPARVTGVQAQLQHPEDLEVDDDATMALSFDTGLTAQVRATWRAAAPVWDAQAASATSAVRVELVPEPSVELNGSPLRLPRPPDGLPSEQLHHLGYLDQLRAVAADAAADRVRGSGSCSAASCSTSSAPPIDRPTPASPSRCRSPAHVTARRTSCGRKPDRILTERAPEGRVHLPCVRGLAR